jgi:hypothetical protein
MRLFALLILLSFSSLSQAATTYYWFMSTTGMSGKQFGSPSAACQASTDLEWDRQSDKNGYRKDAPKLTYVSATRYNCQAQIWSTWTNAYKSSGSNAVSRSGDSCPQSQELQADQTNGSCGCPSGQVVDSTTGLCVIPNNCTSLKDQSRAFQKTGVAPDDFFNISSSNRPVPKSRNACFDGCAAEMTDMRCTHKTTGSYGCKIEASFTGDACGTGGSGPAASSDPAPEPQVDSSSEPCIYKTNADGTQSCESSSTVDKEGKNCGTFNGNSVCVDKNANKNDVKVKTDVKTVSTPDGGTKITKTDTVTVTTCTGVNSCSTSVSTNTSTTTKDAAGNTTGSSSSCIGPSCAANSNQSDGDGDGIGDCVTGECESGGAPQDAELGEVDSFGVSTEKFVDRVEDSNVSNALRGIQAPSGGECYAPKVEVPWLGTVTFDGHCLALEGNTNLIKLIAKTLWAMFAVWILFG